MKQLQAATIEDRAKIAEMEDAATKDRTKIEELRDIVNILQQKIVDDKADCTKTSTRSDIGNATINNRTNSADHIHAITPQATILENKPKRTWTAAGN